MKNIIFDFGNVLLNIDMKRILHGFEAVVGSDADQLMQTLTQKQIFTSYETGGIETTEFLAQIAAADPQGRLNATKITEIWNSIFIGMPAHRFQMLTTLRKTYKVFLLSNINELHLDWITSYMHETHQIQDFEQRYFDGVFYSHLVRMRKPNFDIYEYLLSDTEIKAEESCFFDDLPENIAAAQALGITGYWHDPSREISEHLESLGLLEVSE
jgi:glucose-1-phosphatase